MAIKMVVVDTNQQTRGVTLENGEQLAVTKGDSIRLLKPADIQTLRRGNDLVLKNAKGEEFVLKDFYVKPDTPEDLQLLTWDDMLGQEKELLSEEYSEAIQVAAVEPETMTDAVDAAENPEEAPAEEEDDDDKAAALLLSSSGEAPISMLGAIATVGAVLLMSQGSGGGGHRTAQDTTPPDTPGTAGIAVDDVDSIIGPIVEGSTVNDNQPGLVIPPPGEGETPILYVDGVETPSTWDPDTNTLTPQDPIPDGEHEITYGLEDENGNTSGQSPGITFTIDTTPPDTPESAGTAIDDVEAITGTIPDGGTTNDDRPGLQIPPPGEGETPVLYVDGVEVPATWDPATNTLTPDDPLDEGEHELTYTLRDEAGNESGQSPGTTLTVDTTAPAKPAAPASYEDNVGEEQSATSTAPVTDDDQPGINIGSGHTDTPTLYVDGIETPATYDPVTGTLTPDDPVSEGEHDFTWTLTDTAGNESEQSDPLTIEIDTTAPAKPAAPASYEDNVGEEQSPTSTAPVTDDDQPGINIGAGHTDTPTLYVDGIETPATYDPVTGTLTPDDPVSEGEHDFTWTLTDTAGNESEQSDPLTIEIDTTSPSATVLIGAISDDTGEPGDYITTDQSLTVSGSNSALGAGEKIQISTDGGSTWADVSQLTGTTWQYADPATHGASFTYEVRIVDAAMNIGNGDSQAVTILGGAPTQTITIDSISVDSGINNNDFITNDNDGLIINATLSSGLGAGEVLQYSNDNGVSWSDVASGDITGTAVSFTDSSLTSTDTIRFRVSNGAAYGAEASQLVTIDTTGPIANTISIDSITDDTGVSGIDFITNDGTLIINGSLNNVLGPDERIQISFDGGATWADASSQPGVGTSWSHDHTGTTLPDGNYDLQVRITDTAGNLGATDTQALTIDSSSDNDENGDPDTDISGKVIAITAVTDDTGVFGNDFITSDGSLHISGSSDAADGSHVAVLLDGSIIGYTTVTAGAWSFDYTGTSLSDGNYTLGANLIDLAGNIESSDTQALLIDSTVPLANTINITGITTDSGDAGDFITNDTTLVFNGTIASILAADERIQISLDGGATWQDASSQPGVGASWSHDHTGSVLGVGDHAVQVRIIDTAGNLGATDAQTVTIDTTAPTQTITIASISVDTGYSASDFVTSDNNGLIINATLSSGLGAGEVLQYSNDDGASWNDVDSGDITGTAVSFTDSSLTATNTIMFRVSDGANYGPEASQLITIDTTAPSSAFSAVSYNPEDNALILVGTNFSSLLTAGENAGTDIKARLDWTKLSYDFDSDTAHGSTDTGFTLADIESVYVLSDNTLHITLTSGKAATLEADAKFLFGSGNPNDALDIQSGFLIDAAGNVANTDSAGNLDMGLNLGTVSGIYLNLIKPVLTADGKVYYYLDRSGNGDNAGSDLATHDELDTLLNGGADTIDTQAGGAQAGVDDERTIVLGDYTLALPTLTEATNLYNDPLPNPPSGWAGGITGYYWTSTTSTLGHWERRLDTGTQSNTNDPKESYVAFEVIYHTVHTTVTIESITNDSGVAGDFITNDDDGLTLHATLSTALLSSQMLEYSNDNGATWVNATASVSGTTINHFDATLTSTETVKFRVSNGVNTGPEASQLITIDTTAPTTTIMIDSISVDTGFDNNDFVTSDNNGLVINATLSAELQAGEVLQYSNNNGASWSTVNSGDISGTAVSFTDSSLTATNTIKFRVLETLVENYGPEASRLVTIDTTAPTVSSVAITSADGILNNFLNAGDVVYITVTLSEDVIVSGTPQLGLNIGGSTVQASYSSGSGSNQLVFAYTIQAGQNDANGISIDANSLSLNSGTITDAAGNAATLTHSAVTDNAGYMVDTTAPVASFGPMTIMLEATGVTTGSDTSPQITQLGSEGQFAVTWQGIDSNGDYSIYVQKFNANGTTSGSAVKLEATGVTTGADTEPQITAVGDTGEYVVTWRGSDGSDTSIYVQKFNADGTTSGSIVKLEATGVTNGDDLGAQVTGIGSDGEYLVTWYGIDTDGDRSVYVQRFNADGTTSGSATKLEATGVTNGADQGSQITAIGNSGEYVVSWQGVDEDGDRSIYLQRFNADGSLNGSATKFEAISVGGLPVTTGEDFAPEITALGSGGEYVLTWYGQDEGGDYSIFVQRFNADGSLNGSATKLEATGVTNGDDFSPQVTAIGTDGAFAVTWYGTDANGDYSIFVQSFNADGTPASGISGGVVSVQSTETGTAYLVHDSVVVSTLADITGAADSLWNSVTISAANTSTNLSVAGLQDGNYKLYTVDPAGNLSAPVTSSNVTIDTTAPTVSSVAITSADGILNNFLNAGDVVYITVTLSEDVIVSGTPQLGLNIGSSTVQASYSSGSGSNQLVFAYTIQAGQNDANGISIDANSLSLNSGTITDAAGNATTLTHSAVTDNGGYMVDTTVPTLSSSNPADNSADVDPTGNIVLTFSENITAGSGNIVISNGVDTRTISISDATQISISGNTVTINPTADLEWNSDYNVQMATGVLRDGAGNDYAGISDATTLNFTTGMPSVIDLGTYGQLIHGVQVDDGKWYYYWDANKDGVTNDNLSHNYLDGIFTYASDFTTTNPGSNTTDVYRFAEINGVQLALPTEGAAWTGTGYEPGTTVGTASPDQADGSNAFNPTYDDLLAVWDAYKGTGSGTGDSGVPPGWTSGTYWSATPGDTSQHVYVDLGTGYFHGYDPDTFARYVALEVVI